MNQHNSDFLFGSAFWQGLFGFLRAILFFLILAGFAAVASVYFHGVIPAEVAAQYRQDSPWFFGHWPRLPLLLFSLVVNPYGPRYLLTPLLAGVTVLLAAAKYVMDLYNLDNYQTALRYVVSSTFGMFYPKLVIDKGSKQLAPKQPHLIDKIGGPGVVVVEPGSAAMFRHLRRPGQTVLASTCFLAPFEQIAFVADLDEQQCHKDEIRTITRDGIQVLLSDVHLRYRILQRQRHGSPERRTLGDPYPLEQDALNRMMRNLSVDDSGLDPWTVAVERYVVGEIMDFIAAHPIDYLTAPRGNGKNPRLELKKELFNRHVHSYLARTYGAELIWVDVGHIDIIDPSVDSSRTSLWAVNWAGEASVERAYGEARLQAYQELARAEAQAKIIISLSDSLRQAKATDRPDLTIRRFFIAKAAQILEAQPGNGEKKDQE